MARIDDLDDLYTEYRNDAKFKSVFPPIRSNRVVQGIGDDSKARFLIVGSAPGATEVNSGMALSGASGRVLRQFMSSVGIRVVRNANAWATYAVKYRPPTGRPPSQLEIGDSAPYLFKEWELVGKPAVVIACGMPAVQAYAAEFLQDKRCYGTPFEIPYRATVWPMIDPSLGIRNKSIQRVIQQHWEELGQWLNNR